MVWVEDELTLEIVLDHSGSMSVSKMNNAKTAAKLLVDLAEVDKTSIGVIQFDSTVNVVAPVTSIDSQAIKDSLKTKIDTIQAAGATAIGEAAAKALDELQNSANTKRVVFLLTDGLSNSGRDPVSVIPSYVSAGIPLFTFGFGSDADETLLKRLSADTGGRYYFSPTSLAQLTAVFQDARQITANAVGIATGAVAAQASVPSTFPIVVDSTLSRLDVVATFAGSASDVSISLQDPTGAQASPTNCSVSGSETLCIMTTTAPSQGQWVLRAVAATRDVNIQVRASGQPKDGEFTFAASVTSLTGNSIK